MNALIKALTRTGLSAHLAPSGADVLYTEGDRGFSFYVSPAAASRYSCCAAHARIPTARDGRQSYVAPCITVAAMIASPIMASGFTIADVERIAALAHLELTAEEKQLFTRQLAEILEYARQVQAIDTSGVAPTAHVRVDEGTEREDELLPCLSRDEALANAPDAAPEVGLFRVPRVIG